MSHNIIVNFPKECTVERIPEDLSHMFGIISDIQGIDAKVCAWVDDEDHLHHSHYIVRNKIDTKNFDNFDIEYNVHCLSNNNHFFAGEDREAFGINYNSLNIAQGEHLVLDSLHSKIFYDQESVDDFLNEQCNQESTNE